MAGWGAQDTNWGGGSGETEFTSAKNDDAGQWGSGGDETGAAASTDNVKWDDGGDAFGAAAAGAFDEAGVNGDAAEGGGGSGGRACFNCGEEGHNKADCPNPRVMKCRHCGDEGHVIRDCPTAPPREFTGTCRFCEKEGHMAKDCPEKPPTLCRNCQEEGHNAVDCKNPRKLDRSYLGEVHPDKAWDNLKAAVEEKEMDDIKLAIQQYVKACPDSSYPELEGAFRNQNIPLYFIALEKTFLIPNYTNMDFQGNLDKKYTVTYRFSDKPARPREAAGWPKDRDENLERLKNAGEVVDRGIIKCHNCDEFGHSTKNCPQDKVEIERVTVQCYNCGEQGHRVRDCPNPRVDKFACKNCGQSGHKAAECTEPRTAGPDVECRKCNGTGHFAKDCPEGGGSRGCFNCGEEGHSSRDCPEPKKVICRNCSQEGHRSNECPEPKDMSKVQCRNCDEYGHESRECSKPRDYSRVKCSNCGEVGHTKVRCKQQTVPLDDEYTGDGAGGGDCD